jgi:hypothetical protein
MWLINIVRIALAICSLRGIRWAYVAFIVLGLLYFPLKVGFRFDPHPCELVFGGRLAIHSLTNFPHIVLFTFGFVLAAAQFRLTKWSDLFGAMLITIAVGAAVEILEGVTGQGHFRSRDLIPDAVGALNGAVIVLIMYKIGWRPRPSWSLKWARPAE